MQSRQLSSLKNLAKKLKRLLKTYEPIYDIIIFGSSVRNKIKPNDLDIAIVTSELSASNIGKIKREIDSVNSNSHVQFIKFEDFLKSKLPYYILSEGFSVSLNQFVNKKLGINRKVLFSFNLKDLSQVQKVMFNKGLRAVIENSKSEKVGKGALIVDVADSGEFDDLFSEWGVKVIKKEFLEI